MLAKSRGGVIDAHRHATVAVDACRRERFGIDRKHFGPFLILGAQIGVGGTFVDYYVEGDWICQILSPENHYRRSLVAQCKFAEFKFKAVDGRDQLGIAIRLRSRAGSPRQPLLVAPEIFREFGIIDEGIAVGLHFVDLFLARTLFFAYRVLAVPFQQKIHRPRVERGEGVVAEHVGVFLCPVQVLIAGGHVEVCAGEIAFILVGRFENLLCASTLARYREADFGDGIVERRRAYLAEREVAFCHIGIFLAGVEMIEVDVGGSGGRTSPP